MNVFKLALTAALMSISSPLLAEQKFGSGADMTQVVSITQVIAQPTTYLTQPVTIKGKIVKVCKKKGCWADLVTEGSDSKLTMKVKDGDMVFPMAAIGKTAYATGQLYEYHLSLEKTINYLAHRAEENNEVFEPNSVTAGMTMYRLTPIGVTIKD